MIRTVFAMAVAALVVVAVPQRSQAAPIAPLPAGVIAAHTAVSLRHITIAGITITGTGITTIDIGVTAGGATAIGIVGNAAYPLRPGERQKGAISGPSAPQQIDFYLFTSSASNCTELGTLRPSASALCSGS